MSRWIRRVGLFLVAGVAFLATALLVIRSDRPDPGATGVTEARAAAADGEEGHPGVTVTWLGVTTLLFDDGETRLLTDGFFSRPGLLDLALDRPVVPDRPGIDRALREAGISRLAAVMTVHSHYDHAMDTGLVAARTQALVLGSSSTAQAALGSGLSRDRIVVVEPGQSYAFGRFQVTFVLSRHMPAEEDGTPPFAGTIDRPLVPPAPISAWREGGSYSILVDHPRGAALVQGSAGYVEGALTRVRADVVLLGIGGLSRLGRDYAEAYWREVVGRTGAGRVFPIHWDDFTLTYGDVRPFPRLVDGLTASLGWLQALAGESGADVRLERLPFGAAVPLF